jgi:hypothetical protein
MSTYREECFVGSVSMGQPAVTRQVQVKTPAAVAHWTSDRVIRSSDPRKGSIVRESFIDTLG